MKITDIQVGEISVPLLRPFVTAVRTAYYVNAVIVKITTDTGHIGYGEAAPTPLNTGDTKEAIISIISNYIKQAILGMDIKNMEGIMERLHHCVERASSAKAACDMAIYDLYGKLYNAPLYQILGGARHELKTDMTVSIGTRDDMIKDAIKHVKNGFDIIKIKVGKGGIEDFETIKAIQKEIGDHITLRIDPNQGWEKKEAVRIIRMLEDAGLNIEFVEQPVKARDYKAMAYVTSNVYTTIVADESVFTPKNAIDLIQMGGADIINIKLMKTAGIYNALKICSIAESFGTKCMVGVMLESNLGATAAAHLAGAKGVITMIDLDTPHFCKESSIHGGAIYNGSNIRLTDKPGLGIERINEKLIKFI